MLSLQVISQYSPEYFTFYQSSVSEGYFGSVWTEDSFEQEFLHSTCYGIFEGKEVLGLIILRGEEEKEVMWLGVNPAKRQKGYMSWGLAQVLNQLADEQCVLLEVHEKNQKACNLYMKLGFKQVGYRKRYYNDGGDALVLKYLNCKQS